MTAPARTNWEPILPVPPGAPRPPGGHSNRGKVEKFFEYRDLENQLLGYICRFRSKTDDSPRYMPLTWCRNVAGESVDAWRWIQFPEPRPLFNLDRWKKKRPVLLCVDEETVEHAEKILGTIFNVVTWPGGRRNLGKIDWSPFRDAEVYIWPHSVIGLPQESANAGASAAEYLIGRAASVVGANPTKIRTPAMDLADAIGAGWDYNDLTAFLLDPPKVSTPKADPAPDPVTLRLDDWRFGLNRTEAGKLIDSRENVIRILEYHPAWRGVLALDEFGNRIQIRKPPKGVPNFEPGEWEPQHDIELGLWLAFNDDRNIRATIKSETTISAAVNYVAHRNKFHPVREYLDGLKWDETKRLDDWLTDYLGVKKTQYAAMVGRFFLLSMVARIYEPGCIMRMVPILEGEQWRGKSTALRVLGGAWYSDTPFTVGDKDAYQSLQGNWLYEISEFDSFSRAESTRVKSFVSSVVDDYRAPYDRRNRKWPRQCVFVATTNQDEYLKDSTGNTRFTPVRTGEILVDTLGEMRDQLLAEAVARYRASERRFPTREEQETFFRPEQDQREIADPWQDLIAAGLREWSAQKITTAEILHDILKVDASKIDNSRSMATRIGIALKREGWIKRRPAPDGTGRREAWYERPPVPIPTNNPAQPANSDEPPF